MTSSRSVDAVVQGYAGNRGAALAAFVDHLNLEFRWVAAVAAFGRVRCIGWGVRFVHRAHFGLSRLAAQDDFTVRLRMFTGRLWKAVLGQLGIKHRRSRLGYSWDNGVIERFFGTLKPLLRQIRPRSAVVMVQVLKEFGDFYNHIHRHRTLQGRTPMEAWNGKTLADVQAQNHGGRWVSALDGLLVGFYLRC